jgi:four helix bundle protein
MGNFEKLNVWQKFKNIAVNIYKLTASGRFSSYFGLNDQIRRAAV